MNIQINTGAWSQVQADWLIVGVAEGGEWAGPVDALDDALGGQLARLREAGDLTGKSGDLLEIRDAPGIAAQRVLVVGLGKTDELDTARLDKAVITAARRVSEKQEVNVAVGVAVVGADSLWAVDCAQTIATAMSVGCVGQGLYRAEKNRFPIQNVTVLADPASDLSRSRQSAHRGGILGEAINLTRELVNRPSQEIYPASFAERAASLADDYGLACEVLDENRLEIEKMGSLLAVARGSDRPARVVVLEHRGAGDGAATLGLCGKGVTFDSGGLSLKTSDHMKTMKSDMAGAATVLGAITAIARLELPVNVTGFMGLVENMPGGSSYKLGDVLRARNGTTIEVLNTDAEGRLVLADVLGYAVDRGADKLIDLATLTGACVVALGEDVTGVFTNNQEWCDQVLSAAGRTGEDVWQLPLFELYAELLKSDVADVKNIGGRWGGAITAAKFLEKFVGEKPWVHLDIAGPSFASNNKSHREGGATGCMLRTLVEVAAKFA